METREDRVLVREIGKLAGFAGVFGVLMGLHDAVMGTEAVRYLLQAELRCCVPALICGWLLWRGAPARRALAALVMRSVGGARTAPTSKRQRLVWRLPSRSAFRFIASFHEIENDDSGKEPEGRAWADVI